MSAFLPGRRRHLLLAAGGGLALYASTRGLVHATDEIEIELSGTANGSHVWFRPRGLLIAPGQTVRWVNRDSGNAHTATAYHPDNKKPLRIPAGARSWDSGYLLPGKSFAARFEVPGVYDYFCLPHEQAGMVARIVVGEMDASTAPYTSSDAELPAAALAQFPDVASILAAGRVD